MKLQIRAFPLLFLLVLASALPAGAQEKPVQLAFEPGFTCGAILSGLQLLMPIKAEQEASTLYTLQQLSTYKTFYLKRGNASAGLSEYLVQSDLDQLGDSNRLKIAGQIQGILDDAADADNANRVARLGLTLKGSGSAEKYFRELQGTVATFQEQVAKNDLNPELQQYKKARLAAGVLGMFYGSTVWMAMPLDNVISVAAGIYQLHNTWRMLSFSTLPIGQRTKELHSLFSAAKSFLDQTGRPEHRVLAFSHQYKIHPETYRQAMDTGVLDTQTLVKEWASVHRPLVPAPPEWGNLIRGKFKLSRPDASYVTIDIVLESTGPNPEDTSLHVYARATKTRPKPKKPNIPSPSREREWKTVPGELAPIPVISGPRN